MAFIFNMRSTPKSVHLRPLTPLTPLPVITEDKTSFLDAPPIPPRATNRPANNFLGTPPKNSYEGSPPEYSYYASVSSQGAKEDRVSEVEPGWKDNTFISKRGGWKRLGIIALLALLAIVGLGAGLGVGLTKNKSAAKTVVSNGGSSGSSNTPSSGSSGGASGTVTPASADPTSTGTNSTFPVGSYMFDTFLNTVATNCTSDPATWLCYPYQTYADSHSLSTSETNFTWIISPSAANPKNYTISSTDNPFSITFSNISLSLLKEGQSDEHYFFQTTMNKPTKPTVQLGSSNVASTCYFNGTTFQGYLYTKMAKSFPSSSTDEGTGVYKKWPYAVKIEEVAGAGTGTPTCVGPTGEDLGDYSVSDGTQLCDCLYLNYGT